MSGVTADAAALVLIAHDAVWPAALVLVRTGAAVALLPALGEGLLPARVRLAAVVAITMVLAPGLLAGDVELPTGFSAIIAEAVTGMALGAALRLLVLALVTAGSLAAQSVSLSQMFNGAGPEPQPAIANLLSLAGLALFVALGGLSRAVELLFLSWEVVPPGSFPSSAVIAAWGVDRFAQSMSVAFSLSAPFVLSALLYNLTLGAMNRAMPMLMVTFIGAPMLTLGGLALLALTAPLLLTTWAGVMRRVLDAPFGP